MNVRIYKPSRNAMQSGRGKLGQWLLEGETSACKSPETVMGWASSTDTRGQIKIPFPTQEAAIAFAEQKGWGYVLSSPHERHITPRNYGDNFKYIPPQET